MFCFNLGLGNGVYIEERAHNYRLDFLFSLGDGRMGVTRCFSRELFFSSFFSFFSCARCLISPLVIIPDWAMGGFFVSSARKLVMGLTIDWMGLAGRLGMDLLTVLVSVITQRDLWSTEFI